MHSLQIDRDYVAKDGRKCRILGKTPDGEYFIGWIENPTGGSAYRATRWDKNGVNDLGSRSIIDPIETLYKQLSPSLKQVLAFMYHTVASVDAARFTRTLTGKEDLTANDCCELQRLADVDYGTER